jgi:glycosyltransferase involved in cell wall biosynthesis
VTASDAARPDREAAPAAAARAGMRPGAGTGLDPDIGLVHDWLVTWGGAERVLADLAAMFRPTRLYAIVDFLAEEHRRTLAAPITPTFIQRLPWARKKYWYYSWLMPLAIEQLDLSQHQLIVSSSCGFAKGVVCDPDQLHVCYMHSPARFAWDLQHYYFRTFGWDSGVRRRAAGLAFHYQRLWEVRTAHSADVLIFNAEFIRRRNLKIAGKDGVVVHPPIDCDRFALATDRDDFYLCGSFLNPFKGIDIIVDAFGRMPKRRLKVFGSGPQEASLKARGYPNVAFLGRVTDAELVALMQRARAYLFAAPEDFGMVMAEAQACGTPVIAYGKGGAREIVSAGPDRPPTGVLFMTQDPGAVADAVARCEALQVDPADCRANALRFDVRLFRHRVERIVRRSWDHWAARLEAPPLAELRAWAADVPAAAGAGGAAAVRPPSDAAVAAAGGRPHPAALSA